MSYDTQVGWHEHVAHIRTNDPDVIAQIKGAGDVRELAGEGDQQVFELPRSQVELHLPLLMSNAPPA